MNHDFSRTNVLFSILVLTLLLLVVGCQPTAEPMEDHSATMRPVVEEYVAVWNSGDVAKLDSLVSPIYVRHVNSDVTVEGLDSLKSYVTAVRTTYPDFTVTLEESVYAGDKATLRWSYTGTNSGPGQIPATGNSVRQWGMSLAHFENGLLKEEWVAFDNAATMSQLGYTFTPPAGTMPADDMMDAEGAMEADSTSM